MERAPPYIPLTIQALTLSFAGLFSRSIGPCIAHLAREKSRHMLDIILDLLIDKKAAKGWVGEKLAAANLWLHLDEKVYHRVHDLIIPTSNGTTQIDHVVISVFGIFVVETKNFQGWIFGNPKESNW